MYRWRFCPCRPRERAHLYIPTWTHAVSKNDEISMYIDFSSCRMGKRAVGPNASLKGARFSYHHNYTHSKTIIQYQYTYIHIYIYTYIHTYIPTFVSSIRFLHHLKFVFPCMFAHACRGNYITNMENQRFFRKPEISLSTARATFLDENIKKT